MEERTEDIVIVGAVMPRIEKYIVAEPLVGDRAEQVYETVRDLAKKSFSGKKAFSRHWSFDNKERKINGSSLFHLILANDPEVLGASNLRTPTYEEGRILDSQGRLSNGVYRDFELVVYSEGSPNLEIAKLLRNSTNKELVFPFKAHPQALKLVKADTEYGVGISFRDFPNGVVSGEEVQRAIDSCDYKANSGVHRLDRDRLGVWGAVWDGLAFSVSDGRVDYVCREATADEILDMDIRAIKLSYDTHLKDLQTRRDKALAFLKGKE